MKVLTWPWIFFYFYMLFMCIKFSLLPLSFWFPWELKYLPQPHDILQLTPTPFITSLYKTLSVLSLNPTFTYPELSKIYLFKILKGLYLSIFINPFFFSLSSYTWKRELWVGVWSITSIKKGASWYYSCPFSFIRDLLICWFHSLKNLLQNSKENPIFTSAFVSSDAK